MIGKERTQSCKGKLPPPSTVPTSDQNLLTAFPWGYLPHPLELHCPRVRNYPLACDCVIFIARQHHDPRPGLDPTTVQINPWLRNDNEEVITSLSHLKKWLPAHTYSSYSYPGCSFTNRETCFMRKPPSRNVDLWASVNWEKGQKGALFREYDSIFSHQEKVQFLPLLTEGSGEELGGRVGRRHPELTGSVWHLKGWMPIQKVWILYLTPARISPWGPGLKSWNCRSSQRYQTQASSISPW